MTSNIPKSLLPISKSSLSIGVPLRFNVYDNQGRLLLNYGHVIESASLLDGLLSRGMYVDAVEKQRLNNKADAYCPFSGWDDLSGLSRSNNLAVIRKNTAEFNQGLDKKVSKLNELVSKNPDAAIFEMLQMDSANYVQSHNLQTALLVSIVAKRLNWDDESINVAARAAATMNISVIELQTTLSSQKSPMSELQCRDMRQHPLSSRLLLEELGVTNNDWLRAVEHHHTVEDKSDHGSLAIASLIRHADIYLAKLSPRSYRPGKFPNVAAREILQQETINKSLAAILIKEVGIYPPGSYVRLANGETAIVIQRGEYAHTPNVCSLLNATGMPLGAPIPRNTAIKN